MAIGGIKSLGSIHPGSVYGSPGQVQAPTKSFADQLQAAVRDVDSLQTRRDDMVDGMVTGQATEVHEVMIAAQESQLAFELLLEVRNKLLESYQEVMRMAV